MITKLSKFKDSWIIKILLTLTALSFVSLFGITSYIGSAGKNSPVIEVDDVKINKAEINAEYAHELQMAQNLFGDNLEINENMKAAILQNIMQKELVNAILKASAQDLGVSISDDYIRKIIFSQAEFLDANGQFSHEKFIRLLALSGWDENKYIQTLKQDIIKQHLVQGPVSTFNVPAFMSPYLEKIANQQKVFKYITIDTDKLPVDRKISQEELEQYYQDFSVQFTEPEKRNASFIVLNIDNMSAQFTPSQEEIQAYYDEHIDQFVTPEKRNILQMVFDKEDDAFAAMQKLNAGQDFYAVANEMAKQDKEMTELGWVAKDQLIADMGERMFDAKKNEIAGPVKSEMGWHIMKLIGIQPKSEMPRASADKKIIADLRKEHAYDIAYEKMAQIEDEIGAGKAFADIAKDNNAQIFTVIGVDDQGQAKSISKGQEKLLKSTDFVDAVFSYNVDEISQVIEEEDGFVIVNVDEIIDAHPMDINDVKPEIEKMWADNERSAIAQEILNDVSHDLENGDSINEVAARFKLQLNTTKPLKRNETFANLNALQMREMFQEPLNSAKVFTNDNVTIVAVADKIVDANKKLSKDEVNALLMKTAAEISQESADLLVDAYGSNYDVKVDYKEAGLGDI